MQGLQPLIAFAQTARRGSFAAAARDLGGTPSTIAKSVARLEASLGVRLFHRTTRQVSLTPDGERLFRRCERVLSELEDMQAEAAGSRQTVGGTLRIDAPLAYGRKVLMPVLAELMRRHPELRLDLRLQDGYADLIRDGLDAAVRVGRLQDSRLVARRFDSQQLLLVASPGYLAARGRPERVDQLGGHAAVVFRMPSVGRQRPWQLRSGRQEVELLPEPTVEVNDSEGMVAAAVQGLGIAQLPDNIVDETLASGALVELLPRHRPAAMPISLVMPTARLQPPRVRVLLEALAALKRTAAE
jgi:LysR family transcriptional regulator for bpeEF and oprC